MLSMIKINKSCYLQWGGEVFTFVRLLVYKQDCARTTGQITMKLSGSMWYGWGKNSLHFGVDLDQSADLEFFYHISELGI